MLLKILPCPKLRLRAVITIGFGFGRSILNMQYFIKSGTFLPPATKLGQGNIFTPVCHSVHGGGRVWLLWGGCVVARGACMVAQGACVVAVGGHVWLLRGACVVAAGGAWLLGGACMVALGEACVVAPGGVHGIRRDTEIWSMSGRYASYWNAFLFR